MKHLLLLVCLLTVLCITGCYIPRPVYYVSPYNANATSYHAMPLKSDSVKTATYASANIYLGTANSKSIDRVFDFATNVYQARRFGNFEAYYGADFSVGNYKAAIPVEGADEYATSDWSLLISRVGNKSFAGVGAAGGLHFLHSYHWGDWRILGAEFSTHAESGSYVRFRKDLPLAAADVIVPGSGFSTIGLTTEWIFKILPGSFGLQVAGGWVIGKGYSHIYAEKYNSLEYGHLRYGYVTFTIQNTFNRWTGYVQASGGTYAGGARLGTIYRFGKR